MCRDLKAAGTCRHGRHPKAGFSGLTGGAIDTRPGESDNTGLTATGQRAVPHSGVPATTEPDPGSRSSWPEVTALVAVLAAGVLLVVFGHVATGGLSTACVSMAWLYATFRGSRGRARQ